MSELDEREEGQYSPEHADHKDSEEKNYMPESEDEVSLGDEDFIVPEEPSNKNTLSDSSYPQPGA